MIFSVIVIAARLRLFITCEEVYKLEIMLVLKYLL